MECYGREASEANKKLVEGKFIRLEKDVSEVDRYGRLLRYVYVNDLFVNDYLVRQGFAHAVTYPPDVKYQDLFRQAETEARENNRGLWSGCSANNLTNYKTLIDEDRGERWFCTEEDAVSAGWRKAKNC